MRHGWQMCHLLVNHFGETGKIEARKLLERRSWQNNRLLGSFNVDVDNWVDFFTYTEFVDRDGKFQLNMLSTSGFAPLARSMGPMLREEGFHLGTGHMGLQRIVKAGKRPRRRCCRSTSTSGSRPPTTSSARTPRPRPSGSTSGA